MSQKYRTTESYLAGTATNSLIQTPAVQWCSDDLFLKADPDVSIAKRCLNKKQWDFSLRFCYNAEKKLCGSFMILTHFVQQDHFHCFVIIEVSILSAKAKL